MRPGVKHSFSWSLARLLAVSFFSSVLLSSPLQPTDPSLLSHGVGSRKLPPSRQDSYRTAAPNAANTRQYGHDKQASMGRKFEHPNRPLWPQDRHIYLSRSYMMKRATDASEHGAAPTGNTRLMRRGRQSSAPPGYEPIPELELTPQPRQHPEPRRAHSELLQRGHTLSSARGSHPQPNPERGSGLAEHHSEMEHLHLVGSSRSHGQMEHTAPSTSPSIHETGAASQPGAHGPTPERSMSARSRRAQERRARQERRRQLQAEKALIANKLKTDTHLRVLLADEKKYFHDLKNAEHEMQSRGHSAADKEHLLHDKKLMYDLAHRRLVDYSK